jgi:hypothetical protein
VIHLSLLIYLLFALSQNNDWKSIMFHQLANIEKDDKIVKQPLDKIVFEIRAYYEVFFLFS